MRANESMDITLNENAKKVNHGRCVVSLVDIRGDQLGCLR